MRPLAVSPVAPAVSRGCSPRLGLTIGLVRTIVVGTSGQRGGYRGKRLADDSAGPDGCDESSTCTTTSLFANTATGPRIPFRLCTCRVGPRATRFIIIIIIIVIVIIRAARSPLRERRHFHTSVPRPSAYSRLLSVLIEEPRRWMAEVGGNFKRRKGNFPELILFRSRWIIGTWFYRRDERRACFLRTQVAFNNLSGTEKKIYILRNTSGFVLCTCVMIQKKKMNLVRRYWWKARIRLSVWNLLFV